MNAPFVLDAKSKPLKVGSVVERRGTAERLTVGGFGKPKQELLRIDLTRSKASVPKTWAWAEERMDGRFRCHDLTVLEQEGQG